jgi:YVTN family beta-propeller protein
MIASRLRDFWIAQATAWLLLTSAVPASAQGDSFVNFETIPNRALALSPDGTRLFAANTPDGRLEILDVTEGGLVPAGSVSVGLDPIAIAARSDTEVWVVNHLSDSVSVVDTGAKPPRVVRTLLVGDEPRDIVFAGPNRQRAFITAVRRGQNHPGQTFAEQQVPGVGRADVWVFDAEKLGQKAGGEPLTILDLFADKPGSLAVSSDGNTVFASIFLSGNETTVISDAAVCGTDNRAGVTQFSHQDDGPCRLGNGGNGPGGDLFPNANQANGAPNPRTGMIVKFDRRTGGWLDQAGRDWRDAVPFTLPDNDLFVIDAAATPPVRKSVVQHVGTLNFGLAVHPSSGKIYVAGIEAFNMNRYLSLPVMGLGPNPDRIGGAALTADPITGRTLNGHLYESRVAIVGDDGAVVSRHLNKHIDYEVVPAPGGVKERSVANPHSLLFSPSGNELFVAALGSRKIVPFKTAQLDDDSFVPDAATHIELSGEGGPTDMVMDAAGKRIFAYKRFDNAVSTIDLAQRKEVQVTTFFNPEPPRVQAGRKFFYDGRLSSSNGEQSCNVCHPSGDTDTLAWDFGLPFAPPAPNPNPFVPAPGFLGLIFPDPVQFNLQLSPLLPRPGSQVRPTVEFDPFLGPTLPLTLRGIKDSGPMLWRGAASDPNDPLDERKNFQAFNIVFPAVQGAADMIPQEQFDLFTEWQLSLVPPPNPHRRLDNGLTADQRAGERLFFGRGTRKKTTGSIFDCVDCHRVDAGKGFFGTGGENVNLGDTQFFKTPQLRTVYDKVGMFGRTTGTPGDRRTVGGSRADTGPQIRGSGTFHDGSQGGPDEFLLKEVFDLDARELRQVADFTLVFPSNVAPIVGQQITLRENSGRDAEQRVRLFMERARAKFVLPGNRTARECDLIAKGVADGTARGFLFDPDAGSFLDDRGQRRSLNQLRELARKPGQELTFTCVYPGGGRRMGIDRDGNGTLDGQQSR